VLWNAWRGPCSRELQLVDPSSPIITLCFLPQAPFPPAKAIFVGVDVFLAVCISHLRLHRLRPHIWVNQAACGVTTSYDALVELFERVGNFLKRLHIYTEIPFTPAMTDIIVQIMVEVLSVLALATKEIKQGRFSE
jgi:hypothetical protein